MQVLNSLTELENHGSPAVALTFGNFDGVHQGHQTLLSVLKEEASQKGQVLVVMTFVPHPRKILQAQADRFLLGTYIQRRKWLKDNGVEYLVEIPFTRDFSTQHAPAFLDKYVLAYKNIKAINLGWDFAFGANKEGHADVVKQHCSGHGILVNVCPAYDASGKKVSSTLVRKALEVGDMEEAAGLLGRHFALEGIVVRGEGRGRRIGIPTANLQMDPDILIPAKGVYVTETVFRGLVYRSVTNIGHNPTFVDGKGLTVETHLIDFNGDLYGENLEIRFLSRIRSEKKFPTVNDLISQVQADIEVGRKFPLG